MSYASRFPILTVMVTLTQQKCVPCEGTEKPLERAQFQQYLDAVPQWSVTPSEKQIERDFTFKNFKEALVFVNKVGELAEAEGHHPNLYLHNWKRVKVELTTHAIKGLSLNDFILAAKIEQNNV